MVSYSCAVPGCKGRPTAGHSHKFPQDKNLRRQWLITINNKGLLISMSSKKLKHYRICNKHFKESDYEQDIKHTIAPHLYKQRNLLKPGSIPSVFPFQEEKKIVVRGAYQKREEERNKYVNHIYSDNIPDNSKESSVSNKQEDIADSFYSEYVDPPKVDLEDVKSTNLSFIKTENIASDQQELDTDSMCVADEQNSLVDVDATVDIGMLIFRWNEVKRSFGMIRDEEVARLLLNVYDTVRNNIERCPNAVQDSTKPMVNNCEQNSEENEECSASGIFGDSAIGANTDTVASMQINDCSDDDDDNTESELSEDEPSDEDFDSKLKKGSDDDWQPDEDVLSSEADSNDDDIHVSYDDDDDDDDDKESTQKKRNLYFNEIENDHSNIQCKKCLTIVKKKDALEHLKKEHQKETANCPKCNAIIQTDNMCKHYRKKHYAIWLTKMKGIDAELVCHLCGKVFQGVDNGHVKFNIQKHIKVTHSEKYETCHIEGCGKKIKAWHMKKHLREHNRDSLCCHCGRGFSNKHILNRHIKEIHLQIRDIPCTWSSCDKVFKSKKALVVHTLIHTNSKPLECNKCDYTCRQRAAMNWHIKKQHGANISSSSYAKTGMGRPPRNIT